MTVPEEPRTPDRVSWRERLAYGVGGLPVQFGEAGVKTLAVPVYQMTLMIDPALLGVVMAIPRLIDAFTDPLMGHLSDRTQSRWGRRKPYIMVGAWLTAAAFVSIWFVPEAWPKDWQLGWFLVTSTIFFLCNTVWGVPYQSLGYEITPDYHERTRVMSVQAVFIKVAGFGYQWMFPLAQLALFASVMQGVRFVGATAGVLVFGLAGLLPALMVRERFARRPAPAGAAARDAGFWASCRAVWSHRGMRVLATLTLLQVIAGMLSGALDFYLIVYYMFKGDLVQGAMWKGILSSSYALVGFLAIWPAAWLSRRLDKRTALAVIYVMAAVGGVLKLVFFNPQYPWLLVLDPLLCGPVYVGLTVLLPSMMADICDEDELRGGLRREGMFGAVLSWLRKTGWSLGLLGSGLALNFVGFDATLKGHQAPETITGIRLCMALTTSLTSVAALLILPLYHLDKRRAAEIREQLEIRRGAV